MTRTGSAAIELVPTEATSQATPETAPPRIDRYELLEEIASGGMASIHIARLVGAAGFQRLVAIKRLHPQFARDPEFVAMFLDEALLAARVRHPYVLSTLDVVANDDELFLVMDYVDGETLSELQRKLTETGGRLPPPIAIAVICNALLGLHAAHEARDEMGRPLGIIHRDVSPHNVLVGADGLGRVLDFGVAKGERRMQQSQHGQVKGKIGYMPPEQVFGQGPLTRTADIYAASAVLWEALTGRRLFEADNDAQTAMKIMRAGISPPSDFTLDVTPALDAVVMRGLTTAPSERYETALEMAEALQACGPVASAAEVARFLACAAGESLAKRSARVAAAEARESAGVAPRARAFLANLAPLRSEASASEKPPPRRSMWSAATHELPMRRARRATRIDRPMVALIAAPLLVGLLALLAAQSATPATPAVPTAAVSAAVGADLAPPASANRPTAEAPALAAQPIENAAPASSVRPRHPRPQPSSAKRK